MLLIFRSYQSAHSQISAKIMINKQKGKRQKSNDGKSNYTCKSDIYLAYYD